MALTYKQASQKHREKAKENYDSAFAEMAAAKDNLAAAQQRNQEAIRALNRADDLIKHAEELHRFFYPEPETPAEPEA